MFFLNRLFVILVILILVGLVRDLIVWPYQVNSNAMEPLLQKGDNTFVQKSAYNLTLPYFGTKLIEIEQPKTGDLIAFKSPSEDVETDEKKRVEFRRIVGVPGDVVTIVEGNHFINGRPIYKIDSTRLENKIESNEEILEPEAPEFTTEESLQQERHVRGYDFENGEVSEYTIEEGLYLVAVDNTAYFDTEEGILDYRVEYVFDKDILGKPVYIAYTIQNGSFMPNFQRTGKIK